MIDVFPTFMLPTMQVLSFLGIYCLDIKEEILRVFCLIVNYDLKSDSLEYWE